MPSILPLACLDGSDFPQDLLEWDGHGEKWICIACGAKVSGDTVNDQHWTNKKHKSRLGWHFEEAGKPANLATINPQHPTFKEKLWARFNKGEFAKDKAEFLTQCTQPAGLESGGQPRDAASTGDRVAETSSAGSNWSEISYMKEVAATGPSAAGTTSSTPPSSLAAGSSGVHLISRLDLIERDVRECQKRICDMKENEAEYRHCTDGLVRNSWDRIRENEKEFNTLQEEVGEAESHIRDLEHNMQQMQERLQTAQDEVGDAESHMRAVDNKMQEMQTQLQYALEQIQMLHGFFAGLQRYVNDNEYYWRGGRGRHR